jgi:toxin ParE1/3/4
MLPVLWTPRARRDFEEILEYLEENSPSAADRFATAVAVKCRSISRSPRIGRARNELTEGIRSTVVGDYLIFYRPTPSAIELVRVLHGARDLGSISWDYEEE